MRRPCDPTPRPDPGVRRRQATGRTARMLAALLMTAALLPACDTGADPESSRPMLTRGEFIEAMVALRDAQLELEVADSVPEGRFQELRDSILEAHEVSEAELYAFVNAHPGIAYQTALWDSINGRLKRPLRLPTAKGRQNALPDSMGPLQPPPKPDGIERRDPTRR